MCIKFIYLFFGQFNKHEKKLCPKLILPIKVNEHNFVNILDIESDDLTDVIKPKIIEKNKINEDQEIDYIKLDYIERPIKRIYHLADIHIRNNYISKKGNKTYRYTEYEEVFNNLYEEIRKCPVPLENAIVVICGDLLHESASCSPKAMEQTFKFLENLTKLIDVVLVAGNHELSENGTDDPLEPSTSEV